MKEKFRLMIDVYKNPFEKMADLIAVNCLNGYLKMAFVNCAYLCSAIVKPKLMIYHA